MINNIHFTDQYTYELCFYKYLSLCAVGLAIRVEMCVVFCFDLCEHNTT